MTDRTLEEIVSAYRSNLRKLIEEEQHKRGASLRQMLSVMQQAVTLPEFYREPAEQAAADIIAGFGSHYPAGTLATALQEAAKAVYGAWIREQYRNV